MSRIEDNALPLAAEPVGLREVVDGVFGLLSSRAAQRGFDLAHELGDEVVLADHRRLRQVFLNLVTNAIRHGDVGGRVMIRAGASDDPRTLLVSVVDDGPGIPSDLLGRIFMPFARGAVRPDRTPAAAADEGAQEESIGLGLALAHGLVVAMGGGLEVGRSGPDGTAMRLTLPRAEPPPGPR